MQHSFIFYILLIFIILALVMVASKLRIAYPIVLVLGGLALGLVPAMPAVQLNPEVVFIIFLPPLLYEAAWNTSWKELWRWRRVVSSFAVIIVLVTALIVALVSTRLIPGFGLALGFLLGAIVSPPDAVSASAILRNTKAPRRMLSIVEGESLLNDASSLIIFRFALIAVDSGHFLLHEAALSFVVVIAGGVLCGVAIGVIYYVAYRFLPTTAHMDVVLSLTAPYVMYLAAESFHVSGVLAVVSGGLFLSSRSEEILSYRSRLEGTNVWSMLGFVLNGLVFMLIGLALPDVVRQLGPVSLGRAIWYGLLISLLLIVARILCTLGAAVFTVFISRYITTADNRPGWKAPLALGWAGMRGVVSLAAALSLPLTLSGGRPFEERSLILFITFVVILVTLVFQGLTLPLLLRWLNLDDPDKMLSSREQEALIRKRMGARGLALLEGQHAAILAGNEALQRLQAKLVADRDHDGRDDKDAHRAYQQVYFQLLQEKRRELHDINKDMGIDEEIIRKYLRILDLEEEETRSRFEED